ncbi:MAG: hypothetical protein ACOCWM_01050 [Cyclobacteriaceae bacterium]
MKNKKELKFTKKISPDESKYKLKQFNLTLDEAKMLKSIQKHENFSTETAVIKALIRGYFYQNIGDANGQSIS